MILEILLFALFSAGGSVPAANETTAIKSVACDFFGPENAAKILGVKFRGEDAGMTEDADGRSWRCTFLRPDEAEKAGPKIYFVMIKNTSEDAAIRVFESVRASNRKHKGFSEWPGIGDEAVVHTDSPNFHFLMVRKGVKTIRIKVNPADGISLDQLKVITASIAGKL